MSQLSLFDPPAARAIAPRLAGGPRTVTKELAVTFSGCRAQDRLRISSNLLGFHGFTPGERISKRPRQDGAGFDILLDSDGDQIVHSRRYSRDSGSFSETMIEIGSAPWMGRLLGARRVRVVSRPGRIRITPIPDLGFNITRKLRPLNRLPMFSILSSGLCAHAMTAAGFSPEALCEWRPPEKRDIAKARDLTETGAMTALANVPFPTVFNQDVFSLTPALIDEALGNTPIAIVAGSLQCDSFSSMKSQTVKDRIREGGEMGDAELFYPVLRLIEKTQPAAVFIENVPSFLKSEIGGAFKAILRRLGYFISQATLNSADFGSRTSRPRGFLVASIWPGFEFPAQTARPESPLYDWLGAEEMTGCKDVTDSNMVARAKAKGRMRSVKDGDTTAPTFPKSQHRVDDRVLFEQSGRILDPSIPAMRRIHGIPSTFRMEHLAEELQVETIGQGVDYRLLSLLASTLKAHVDRNLATKLGV